MTNRVADDSISVPGPIPGDVSDRIAIVDTNVVVAGLITASSSSPVARIVGGMGEASFAFTVSEPLVAEYRNVLARPSLMRLHGRSPRELETILVGVLRHAIVLAGVPGPPAPDPGDQFLWDLLSARAELVLVTGDKLLLSADGMRGRVVSAASWMG